MVRRLVIPFRIAVPLRRGIAVSGPITACRPGPPHSSYPLRRPISLSRTATVVLRCARMVRPAVPCALIALPCCLLAGCGATTQSSGEAAGRFPVRILSASFPAAQQVARPTTLSITVENAGPRTLPDVSLTLNSLTYRASHPKGLADPERPDWVIDVGPGPLNHPPVESEEVNQPGGAQTALVHTWALGRLRPQSKATFTWHLTPVLAGTHTVRFTVAAGLDGRAVAVLQSGVRATGGFTVHVAPKPRATHVNPRTGAVEVGVNPVAPGPVGAVP